MKIISLICTNQNFKSSLYYYKVNFSLQYCLFLSEEYIYIEFDSNRLYFIQIILIIFNKNNQSLICYQTYRRNKMRKTKNLEVLNKSVNQNNQSYKKKIIDFRSNLKGFLSKKTQINKKEQQKQNQKLHQQRSKAFLTQKQNMTGTLLKKHLPQKPIVTQLKPYLSLNQQQIPANLFLQMFPPPSIPSTTSFKRTQKYIAKKSIQSFKEIKYTPELCIFYEMQKQETKIKEIKKTKSMSMFQINCKKLLSTLDHKRKYDQNLKNMHQLLIHTRSQPQTQIFFNTGRRNRHPQAQRHKNLSLAQNLSQYSINNKKYSKQYCGKLIQFCKEVQNQSKIKKSFRLFSKYNQQLEKKCFKSQNYLKQIKRAF